MLAHFLFLLSLQGFLMYQLQLTTSQVGLQDISEHRGAAGSLSASSLTPSQTSVHGFHWCLVPGRQRDTWPNHRNTSSCRLPDAHHREKPGQRWRSSSGVTTSPNAHIHLYLQCKAVLFNFWQKYLRCLDLIWSSSEVESNAEMCIDQFTSIWRGFKVL